MQKHESFPLHLREELGKRQRNNPNYSLRAFAQSLGVSSSFLSKVINGKKALGENTFLKIASRLDLETESVEAYRAKLPGFKAKGLNFDPLDLDHFQHIADWHHYAILEATTLADFEPSVKWVAERLGLTAEKAQTAIDRLIRLGYLKKSGVDKFASNAKNLSTAHHPVPSAACREHERQVLALAMRALDEVDIDHRDQTSLTVAIPASRMTEAREKIDQFRQEMAGLLQRRGKRDAVYHLSVSLYPVTKLNKKNGASK
jgi:transcriptional regulator with XRE-family HTH domain